MDLRTDKMVKMTMEGLLELRAKFSSSSDPQNLNDTIALMRKYLDTRPTSSMSSTT
jgi:hypothetical protein